MKHLPSVSVILPVLDEADSIGNVLTDLVGQDYPGQIEIVVADGGSIDGTLDILSGWEADSRVTVIDNPGRGQSSGLNLAAERAEGSVLVRADGHTRYAGDYIRQSVDVLGQMGGAVGGRMTPVGTAANERAVAAAMNSPMTMGPGRFHHALSREEVDTVYLGAFHKEDFQAISGFRSFPSGSSEDADFYYRWRRSGRQVFVDPTIQTSYRPRGSWGSLWRQYWRYGQGKTEMLWVNGRLPSWRPLAPIGLVLAMTATVLSGVLSGLWVPAIGLAAAWIVLLVAVGASSGESAPSVVAAAGIMHIAYGLGAIFGFFRGPYPVRHLR